MSDTKDPGAQAARRLAGGVPLDLVLVGLGGAAGTLARFSLTEAMPSQAYLAVLLANVSGALALGILVTLCAGRRPRLQLLLGTGVCGGFTTYSAFAVGVEQLADSQPWWAVGLALVTVGLGLVGTLCGVWIGGALRGTRDRSRPRTPRSVA